jgi:4-diphosphocytidyl-2-C-methyl-D-erythritol kinase
MYLHRKNSVWIALAPAKVNLYLDILGQRFDGFHELETLMVPLGIYDTLCLTPFRASDPTQAGPIELSVRSARGVTSTIDSIPTDEQNLIVSALQLLQRRSGCETGARVQLHKRIPTGAGLGGGSSDAAAALSLANHAWGLNWNRQQLAEVAQKIGSDVAFFLANRPAVCRGRGEQVEPIQGIPPLYWVVVKPPTALQTSVVYAENTASSDIGLPKVASSGLGPLLQSLRRGRIGNLQPLIVNHLQSAAARISPWINRLATAFGRLDFSAHQMTGSGSAYFGVCRNTRHATRLAAVLQSLDLGVVYTTRSCR